MNKRKKIERLVAAGLLLGGSIGATHAADQQAPAAPEATEEKLTQVVVTGSNVPTKRDQAAVSVVSIDAEQMQKGGVQTDVLEILRKAAPSFQGRSNAGASNANGSGGQVTGGGNQIQNKNLDTLVLVNGRRTAISGIAAIGGKAFVNGAQIPTSAIDHIEVISDGSSAIYGSDAIGGVVNIILKSNYDGADAGFRYGSANDYTERSEYFTVGKTAGDFNLTVSGSDNHADPLSQNKRAFSTPITGRISAVPGTIGGNAGGILAAGIDTPSAKNPTGVNATATTLAQLIANGTYGAAASAAIANTYDLSQFQQLLIKQDQQAVSFDTGYKLMGKKLVFFADGEFSKNKNFVQQLPVTSTVTVPNGAPFNPLRAAFPSVNFANWAQPKQVANDQQSERLTAGLRGNLGDGWTWETALLHSRNTLQQKQINILFAPNLALAIAGGYNAAGVATPGGAYSLVYGGFSKASAPNVVQPALDPFARGAALNPASTANLYGTEVIDTASTLDSFDAGLTGVVTELPAGKARFATGVQMRRETLSGHTDANGRNTGLNSQLWTGGVSSDPFDKSRDVAAAYLELRAPVTSSTWQLPGAYALDLILADRVEHYSETGVANVPKLGFRWQPLNPSLTVRGSFAKSFTAPTLFARFGPSPSNTRLGAGSLIVQALGTVANNGFQAQSGNNPDLQPSKADTKSINFTLVPVSVPGLTLSAEYSQVDQHGYPGGIGLVNIIQSVNQSGSASPFYNSLAAGNFPGQAGATQPFATPGSLLTYLKQDVNNSSNMYVIDRFMNLGGVKVRSVNLNGEYQLPATEAGTFTVATAGTVFSSYKFQALPYQQYYEYAGTSTNNGTGVQGTLPKYRFYTTADWRREEWNATLGMTYVSSVTDIAVGGIVYETNPLKTPLRVPSYVSWDLRLAYQGGPGSFYKGWTFALGVNNIANRMPPLSPQAFTDNNADTATYSPIGRLVYVSGSLKF